MSFMRRLYDLLMQKSSAAIDAASDPEEKIRLTLHELEETGPAIRDAVSGPIAEAAKIRTKLDASSARVADLTAKVQAAVTANNQEVARIRGGQLLDAKNEQASLQARLSQAEAKATEARERYEDWKRKTAEMQSKALASLDENRRAEAQEKFNKVMVQLDSTAVDSSLGQAMDAITDRAARADAAATLDENPDERALRDDEKKTRQNDITALLADFQSKAETGAAS